MRLSRDALLLIGLLGAAVVFALTYGGGKSRKSDVSTSYSTYDSGVKAVYTLLGDRLGCPRRGGTAAVVSDRTGRTPVAGQVDSSRRDRGIHLGLPPEHPCAVRDLESHRQGPRLCHQLAQSHHQQGRARLQDITNKGARDYRNVMRVVNIIAEHTKPGDLILFDEYHHGIGRSAAGAILLHTQRQVEAGARCAACRPTKHAGPSSSSWSPSLASTSARARLMWRRVYLSAHCGKGCAPSSDYHPTRRGS